MPTRPENGARTIFFSIRACCCATCACFDLRSASSASTVAWLTACTSICARSRSSTVLARSAAACRVSSCAFSGSALSSNRMSPWATFCPELTATRRTSPATSVARSVPRHALRLPTVSTSFCHSSSWAAIVVTTGGAGGLNPAICFLISTTLIPMMAPTSRRMPTTMKVMRLASEGLAEELPGRGCTLDMFGIRFNAKQVLER